MNTKTNWLGALLVLTVLVTLFTAAMGSVMGQEASSGVTVNVTPDSEAVGDAISAVKPNIWQAFIPVLVPIVIKLLKGVFPKIPKGWLPWLCPLIGALADVALNYSGLASGNGAIGALLGMAGNGLREMYDQGKQAMVKPKIT